MRINSNMIHKRQIIIEISSLMSMPKQITSTLFQTFFLQITSQAREMGHEKMIFFIIQHNCPSSFYYIRKFGIHLAPIISVMITIYNMDFTIEFLNILNIRRVAQHQIAQTINIIFGANNAVPTIYVFIIHLLDRIKSTNLPDEFSVMPEVHI